MIGRDAGERGFRPDIAGLRAVAVTMVVIYHLFPSSLPGGFVGVDVFFVISGFLITGQLWRGFERSGKVRLVDFWSRRARRLLPAAALVLAVTWGVARLVLPSSQLPDTAEQIRASALYYQNWLLAHDAVNYLSAGQAATPVQHFWSLSVEEQFYLVWPLLFVLAALVARRHPKRVLVALMVTLVAASLAYSVYDTQADPAAAYFVTPTRMWELGAGGLLALRPALPGAMAVRRSWLGWAGLGLVLASPFVLRGTTAFPGALALLPVTGAVLLIAAGPDRGPAWLLGARPLVFLGGISYSLYLWHWPVIDLWTAYQGKAPGIWAGLVIIVVSVALAWLTKVLVEDPVRRSPVLSGHQWRSLSTALAVALPVALVTVYIAGIPGQFNGKVGPGYPGAAALASALAVPAEPVLPPPDDAHAGLPVYWRQGCLVDQQVTAPKECVYGDTANPSLTVALVGDSIAGNWFPALEQLALRYHWKLVTDTHAVCTFTATMLVKPGASGGPYTACHAWGVSVLHDLLTSIHPDVVITSDLADLGSLAHPAAGPQAFADIAAGMASYWTQLEDHRISVVPIEETPTMSFDPADCVAKYGASSPKCEEPLTEATHSDPPTVRATQLMQGRVKLIDMNQFVCDRNECPSVVGNILIYFDAHHMTSNYSTTIAPYLAPRLFSSSAVLASHR